MKNGKKNNKNKKPVPENLKRIIFAVILIIICLVTYSKITSYRLVFFDDADLIEKYTKIIADKQPVTICFQNLFGDQYYRPVLGLSFFIDATLYGADPKGYYISNILFHALAILLIFLLFIKLKIPDNFSFLASLLLAVHPILTPAVAWISGRNDPLLLIFSVLAFIFFLDLINSEKQLKRNLFLLLHGLSLLIAIFTKESAIVLPLLFLLYLFLFRSDFLKSIKITLPVVIWLLGAGIYLYARHFTNATVEGQEIFGLKAFVLNLPSVFAIFGKIFLPWKMNGSAHFENFSVFSGIIIMLALTFISILRRKEMNLKYVLFYFAWFLGLLLPTLLIKLENPHFDYMEHRSYPIIFAVVLIIYEILKSYKVDFKKTSVIVISSILIVVFFVKTNIYCETFSDRKTFQQSVIEMYPENYTGYYNLGKAYSDENNYRLAMLNYTTAIQKNPNDKNVYIYLGNLYIKNNEISKAENALRQAEKIDSADIFVTWNLGRVYLLKNDTAKALAYYESALKHKNSNPVWLGELAINFLTFGNYPKAIIYFNRAIEMNPSELSNYINLGVSYFYNHQPDKAEETWKKASEVFPSAFQPHVNLVELYLKTNNTEQAKIHAKEAVRLGGFIAPEISWLLH